MQLNHFWCAAREESEWVSGFSEAQYFNKPRARVNPRARKRLNNHTTRGKIGSVRDHAAPAVNPNDDVVKRIRRAIAGSETAVRTRTLYLAPLFLPQEAPCPCPTSPTTRPGSSGCNGRSTPGC